MSRGATRDIDAIEAALTNLIRTLKRPQIWEHTMQRAGVHLDHPGAAVLKTLLEQPTTGCHVSTLAHRLFVEAPTMTRKVQQLEDEGFIERLADPADKRASIIRATEQGRHAAQKIHKVRRADFSRAIHHWSAEDRAALVNLLDRLANDLSLVLPKK